MVEEYPIVRGDGTRLTAGEVDRECETESRWGVACRCGRKGYWSKMPVHKIRLKDPL